VNTNGLAVSGKIATTSRPAACAHGHARREGGPAGQNAAGQRYRWAAHGLKILAVFGVLLQAHPASAVVNPQLALDAAPVVVSCVAVSVTSTRTGTVTSHNVVCDKVSIKRAPANVEIPSPLTISYSIDHASVRRQYEDMQRKVDEGDGWAGPAPDVPPAAPPQGRILTAYLDWSRSREGTITFSPATGIDSFSYAGAVDPACEAEAERATNSSAKLCEENRLADAEARLSVLVADILSRTTQTAKDGDLESLRKAAAEQSKMLEASQAGWREYRDQTCGFVYYQYYPGSMASLARSACLREVTEKRIRQLDSAVNSDGETAPEY